MKILITENYGEENLKKLVNLGCEVSYINEKKITNNEMTDNADILIGYNPFETLDISKLKNLKYIQLTSVGFNHVPKEKIKKQDIILANYKGGFNIPMAEWIVMSILNSYKNTFSLYEKQKSKKWQPEYKLDELHGKTIGFIGTGEIAREAAKRLKCFETKILGINTNGRKVDFFDECFSLEKIDLILKTSDIVILAVPGTKANYNLINEEKINLIKDNSILINISRGNVLDENALIKHATKFKSIILDVVKEEPLHISSKLWQLENIIITPHNSWISIKNRERTFNMIYENVKRFIDKKEIINIVNIDKGY